ncbi:unnamed protein product [Urochloa humidicola]
MPSSTFVMQEETGAQSNPMAGESGIVESSIPDDDLHKSNLLEWVEAMESSDDSYELPPSDIVLFPDLLVRAWKWARLVPYTPPNVEWSKYKLYLKQYLEKNTEKVAALCGNQQPESIDDGLAAEFLKTTADECVKVEKKLLCTCLHDLTSQDIFLGKMIIMRKGHIVRSESGFRVKAVGLMCIMKEAKLMCMSRECNFDTREIITISNKVRRSALNLMLNKGNESDLVAATAAMVGLVVEAAQRAPGRGTPSNKSGKLKGVSDTNFEEYDSTENSRKDTEGEKKRESSLNNQTERKLSKRKLKDKKRATTVDMNSEKDSIELSGKDINEQKSSLNNQAGQGNGKAEAEGGQVGEERRKLKVAKRRKMPNKNADCTELNLSTEQGP